MARSSAELPVAATARRGDLERTLARVFSGVARKRVVVGFHDGAGTHFAAVGQEDDRAAAFEWAFPVGCVTKILTSALIGLEVDTGHITLDEPVAGLFPAGGQGVLAGVTLRMLLEHTHGLDASVCDRLPLHADGRIDAPRLLSSLGAMPLASPGALYSYSNAGAWIAAAVLERLNGMPFQMQLRRRLLEPLGVSLGCARAPAGDGSTPACPATGGGLALSAADLMKCVRWMAERWPPPVQDHIVALPGWNPLEYGAWRGWKCYGHGWLGHQSAGPGASVLVRVHPRRGLAVVLASKHHHAAIVAGKLFADLLPELVAPRFLKPLAPDAAANVNVARYCGLYGMAAERLLVEPRDGSSLRLVGPSFEGVLVPAVDEVFYLQPAHLGQLAFVQFVGSTGRGFRYLWDSRSVLRRKICPDEPD